MLRSTHTLAELEISPAAYKEIADKLRDAAYDQRGGLDYFPFCERRAHRQPFLPLPTRRPVP